MTTKTRIKDLEARITSNDETCLTVDWGRGVPPKCPKGIILSNDLHECNACSVPEKSRDVLQIVWIDKTGKPREPRTCLPSTND
jgi:hypothetical protein